MANADKQAFLNALQNLMDEHIPAKISRLVLDDAKLALMGFDMVTVAPVNGENNDSKQLIQSYVDAKAVQGASQKTLKRYKYLLTRMYEDINVPIRMMTTAHLRDYMAEEMARGISKNTIKGCRAVYNNFFEWLWREEIISKNPVSNVGQIKAKAEPRESFSGEEIQLIKEAANNSKERAMVYFLLASGCRVGELISINRKDVDYQGRKLLVRGKGDKTREVYFDDVTAMMLQRYLSERKDDHPELFRSRNNRRYSENGVEAMMRRISERTGIHVYPHRFRHTFAQTMLDRGMSIEEVSRLLGHEKIDTTLTYARANQRNTENSYRKYACM